MIKPSSSAISQYDITRGSYVTNLLLEVLANLVVNLELHFNLGELVLVDLVLVIILWRGSGRAEKVEERVGRTGLLDKAGTVGVYKTRKSVDGMHREG
jgi:hypothetical protein